MSDTVASCTAFEGTRRIASGSVLEVALRAKEVLDRGTVDPVLIFDDATSRQVEVDFRGTADDVRRRLEAAATTSPADSSDTAPQGSSSPTGSPTGADAGSAEAAAATGPRGRGRPRLGVVAREVTLLPRHWEWLRTQPGSASVTLRKLVEEARRAGAGRDRIRLARESAYRFMNAMAGDQPGFEEAVRALFAGDAARLEAHVRGWPADVRQHALELARPSFV